VGRDDTPDATFPQKPSRLNQPVALSRRNSSRKDGSRWWALFAATPWKEEGEPIHNRHHPEPSGPRGLRKSADRVPNITEEASPTPSSPWTFTYINEQAVATYKEHAKNSWACGRSSQKSWIACPTEEGTIER